MRLYSEARNDRKLNALNDQQFRVWFRLLCMAGEGEGELRGTVDASRRRLLAIEVGDGDEDALEQVLARLQQLYLIEIVGGERIIFPSFLRRNPQMTYESATPNGVRERVRRHRAARGTDNETSLPDGGHNETSLPPASLERRDREQLDNKNPPLAPPTPPGEGDVRLGEGSQSPSPGGVRLDEEAADCSPKGPEGATEGATKVAKVDRPDGNPATPGEAAGHEGDVRSTRPAASAGTTPAGSRRRRGVVQPQYSPEFLAGFNAYPNIRGCRDGKAGASISFAALVGEEGYDAAELARAAGRYADHCRDPDARPVGIDRFYSRNAMHAGKSGRIFEQYLDDAAGAQKQSTIRTKGGKYDKYVLTVEQAYERRLGRKYCPDGGGATGEPATGPVGAADAGDGHEPGAVPVGVQGDAQRAVQPVPRPAGGGGLGVASVRFGAGPGTGPLPHEGVLPARPG